MTAGVVVLAPNRLAELEVVIERGLATFVQVGRALGEVRDDKLYRPEYRSFKDYVAQRWDRSYSWAYLQIRAAETSTVVEVLNERQARKRRARPARPVHAEQAMLDLKAAMDTIADFGQLDDAEPLRPAARRARMDPEQVREFARFLLSLADVL